MTTHIQNNDITPLWVTGDLQLAGILDNRIIELLKAINQSGSLNQAAKQVGLSYKGAWQIIERANNSSPKTLVATAIGGTKGGGTVLTEAGQALIHLFEELQGAHQLFLKQLNQNLAANPEIKYPAARAQKIIHAAPQFRPIKRGARRKGIERIYECQDGSTLTIALFNELDIADQDLLLCLLAIARATSRGVIISSQPQTEKGQF